MLCPPHASAPIIVRWFERHRTLANLTLHMAGIPATILGILLLPIVLFVVSFRVFALAGSLFVVGYLLQFWGHALEGTESAEWAAITRGFSKLWDRLWACTKAA